MLSTVVLDYLLVVVVDLLEAVVQLDFLLAVVLESPLGAGVREHLLVVAPFLIIHSSVS